MKRKSGGRYEKEERIQGCNLYYPLQGQTNGKNRIDRIPCIQLGTWSKVNRPVQNHCNLQDVDRTQITFLFIVYSSSIQDWQRVETNVSGYYINLQLFHNGKTVQTKRVCHDREIFFQCARFILAVHSTPGYPSSTLSQINIGNLSNVQLEMYFLQFSPILTFINSVSSLNNVNPFIKMESLHS